MQKLTILSVLISCGLFATACSSSTSGGSTFSCDFMIATAHECSEYTNLPSEDESAESSACTAESGTAGTGCPTDNSLGSCAFSSGGISYSTFYYSDGGETADDASMGCTASGGMWTAT